MVPLSATPVPPIKYAPGMTKFGFEVSVQREVVHEPHEDVVKDVWYVELPHQCSEWTVAHGSKAEVAAELSRFIAEAKQTLADLADVEPCPHDWIDTDIVWKTVDRSTAAPWYAQQYRYEATSTRTGAAT
jgi:hypothetical protein